MKKNVPTKHHPLFNAEESTLDFGENVTVLTDDQKVDAFISKYMDKVDPFITYKKYFESSAKTDDHIIRDIKLYFKKLVVEGSWTERKYVTVLNDILENRIIITIPVLDHKGLLYEKGLLASQKRLNKRGRR